MDDKKRTCFIITPIGDESDPIRRHIEGVINTIITPIMGNDYEIKVAHKLFETGSINKQIIELIYKSDLVIANLTQTNPNVMYELAFRHTLGTPTITIAEYGTKLPFDVSSERTIFYKNDIQGVAEAQEELKKYLDQIDYNSGKTMGPIHDYLDSTELNNLIYSRNKNKNTTEILDLMVKRLDRIDSSISNITKDVTSKLVDNKFNTVIKQKLDLMPLNDYVSDHNPTINFNYFNLFVIGREQHNESPIHMPKGKILTEYTSPEIRDIFLALTTEAISVIKTFPTVVVNKTNYNTDFCSPIVYGYITDIYVMHNGVKVYYNSYNVLQPNFLRDYSNELCIEKLELSMVHWSIKRANLVEEIKKTGNILL